MAFGNLDSNEYRVSIGDLPESLVFAENEAIVFVPENGEANQEFRALADGTTNIRVYGPRVLDDVSVKLLDPNGEIVAVGRTGSPPELPGEITFSGLRRQTYEAHISEYPDWVEFAETTQPVDLLRFEEYTMTFLGDVLGEWTLEVGVTADGIGLEGTSSACGGWTSTKRDSIRSPSPCRRIGGRATAAPSDGG